MPRSPELKGRVPPELRPHFSDMVFLRVLVLGVVVAKPLALFKGELRSSKFSRVKLEPS